MTDPNHGYDQPELSEAGDPHLFTALDFMARCGVEDARICSSIDVTESQLREAEADHRLFQDDRGRQWVLLPWDVSANADLMRDRRIFRPRTDW